MTSKYLAIYLNDHFAGASFGTSLAARIAARDDPYGPPVREIAKEIAEDRKALAALMARLGVGRDHVKAGVAWVAEKAERLKLNGRLLRTSPLSRFEELELLSLGVEGKASMWRALIAGLADGRVDRDELERLLRRAESQRERVEALRLRAAAESLPG
jgi:hypothetical protein